MSEQTTANSLADLKNLVQGTAAAVPGTEGGEKREPKRDAQGRAYATGKRKNAVARVWIKPGKGTITINGRAAGQRARLGPMRFRGRRPFPGIWIKFVWLLRWLP